MTDFKIPKQPFFKPGSLVFKASGHKLIKDGKYYRCSKDSNQICAFHDRRILTDTLEKKFSRLGAKLYVKNLDADMLLERLMRENFLDLIFGLDEKRKGKEELTDATIDVMKQDVVAGKSLKRADEKDFSDSYINSLKADYPMMLFGFALGTVRAVTCELKGVEAGKGLAYFAKRIYVTDRGEIDSIELERWAWYVIKKIVGENISNSPTYLKSLKILNKEDGLHKLSIAEASLSFGSDDFSNGMSENFLMPVVMMKMMKESIKAAMVTDTKEMNKSVLELLNQFQNNPVVRVLFGAVPLIPSKK